MTLRRPSVSPPPLPSLTLGDFLRVADKLLVEANQVMHFGSAKSASARPRRISDWQVMKNPIPAPESVVSAPRYFCETECYMTLD